MIQHNDADGTYKTYRENSFEIVDSGEWKIEGTTLMEINGNWKGDITMRGKKDYSVQLDFQLGGHD